MGADTDKPFTYRTIHKSKINRYWFTNKYLLLFVVIVIVIVIIFTSIYIYISKNR